MRVGQADTAFVVVRTLRVVTTVRQVGGASVGHGIAQAGRDAFGLVLGAAGFVLEFVLQVGQASAEITQFGAQRGGNQVAALLVVDLGTVDGLIAQTEGEDVPVTDGRDRVAVVALVQVAVVGRIVASGRLTCGVTGKDLQAAQRGSGVGDGVVTLAHVASQRVRAVVPALARHVAGFDSLGQRHGLTAQFDGTEATAQAHPRLALPEAAGRVQAAVVGTGAVLQVEDAFQAVAQVFRADDADAGAAPDTVVDLQVALAGAAGFLVQAFNGNVNAAQQLDGGLGLSECWQGCRNGQRNKRFFHESIS